ncbi:hypothetical protein NDU88_004261 [Pleurodeles waltl]|uniref:Uncharacterized protein n=1 Tax=Pleurodeles waltl TaxID=8319 RepID=A0AAV7QCF7_PLEWA|nr:hypothetical protein NDU88_004261 [Pleurodeles waltl]
MLVLARAGAKHESLRRAFDLTRSLHAPDTVRYTCPYRFSQVSVLSCQERLDSLTSCYTTRSRSRFYSGSNRVAKTRIGIIPRARIRVFTRISTL